MTPIAVACEKLLDAATRHPEGDRYLLEPDPMGHMKERRHVFQFELEDGDPFYISINKKEIKAGEGTSPLDWRGEEWNQISRLWTDRETLKSVIYGEKNLILEWHEGKWDFASRNSNSPFQSWFCILLRLAREELERELLKSYFAREIESGLDAALEKLLKKVKDFPEGKNMLTQPDIIVKDVDTVEKWEHTFQFEIEDAEPFYLEIANGDIAVTKGATSLDWQVKDWERCTRVWTTAEVLKGVLQGEKNPVLEWHDGLWDFSSRIGNSHFHSWLCILLRMAKEQWAKELVKDYLAF